MIPLAGMLIVGSFSLLFDRSEHLPSTPSQPRISSAVYSHSCDCVWASTVFGDLALGKTAGLQFRRMHVQKNVDGTQWQGSEQASVASDAFVAKPTCACCLDDFHPSSQVAVLPCGHIFHEDCIAHWSLASAHSANPCPTCRKSFECSAEVEI